MVRPILLFDQPVLRQKARRVSRVDGEILRLVDDMVDTMLAAPGVGLAAPQIGVGLRVAVVRTDDSQVVALINPEIIKAEGSQIGYEGCLSYPGWIGEVERAEEVVVRALNRKGKQVRHKVKGYTARVFQHEIDHLDGILYIDRLTSLSTLVRSDDEAPAYEMVGAAQA